MAESQQGYHLICKDCGRIFTSKGANAFYCKNCSKERKKRLDHQAWLRRRNKAGCVTKQLQIKHDMVKRLEKQHAQVLHIDYLYYGAWKLCHPLCYQKWVESQLPEDLLSVGRPLVSKSMLRDSGCYKI